MRIVNAKIGSPIHIGRQGENLATKVVFNIDDLVKVDPSEGKVELWVQQNGIIYPQSNLETNFDYTQISDPEHGIFKSYLSGGEVEWLITNEVTQTPGKGQCELFYFVDEVLIKSVIYDIVVNNSIDSEEGTEPPEYASNWIEEINNSAFIATEAAKSATSNASAAADSASAAASSKEAASISATTASNKAEAAAGSASAAASSASAAASSAGKASGSASAAASSASTAADSAQTASDKANAAAQSVIEVNQIKTDVTNIQKDIATKYGEINTKHEEIVEKHNEVVTKHQDIITKYQDIVIKHQDVVSKHQEVKTLHSEVKTLHGEVKSNATQVSAAWTNIKEVQVPHINEQAKNIDEWAKEASQDAESAAKSADAAEKSAEITSHPPYMNQDSGNWMVYSGDTNQYEDTGVRYSLSIIKSYSSVVNMEADLSNMREGDLVIIASNVGDEDNSKLYVHTGSAWKYLSDLSGLEGIGIASITKTNGTGQPGTKDTYTITLTDGRVATTIDIYQGKDGEGVGDMKAENYDPTGAVYAAGGIEKYVENSATKVTLKTWTAADI